MNMQVSATLRKTADGYSHWCPGCGETHRIPTGAAGWSFNGNVEKPTFSPSVRLTGKQTVKNDQGGWTGEWVRGPDGKALDYCCHYFINDGVIDFQGDCTHAFKGCKEPLPDLPEWLRD